MMFYNAKHTLDADVPAGTLVAVPNYSYVVTAKGVASRMGIVLRIYVPEPVDDAVLQTLRDREACMKSSILLFPTLKVSSIQITPETILSTQRSCVISDTQYFRATLPIHDSIDRFTFEIETAKRLCVSLEQ